MILLKSILKFEQYKRLKFENYKRLPISAGRQLKWYTGSPLSVHHTGD